MVSFVGDGLCHVPVDGLSAPKQTGSPIDTKLQNYITQNTWTADREVSVICRTKLLCSVEQLQNNSCAKLKSNAC